MKSGTELLDDTLKVTLLYPRVNPWKFIEVDLCDVRANDGIRLYFDFDRDGWVVQQPTKLFWEADEEPDMGWKESAFIQGWKFIDEEEIAGR